MEKPAARERAISARAPIVGPGWLARFARIDRGLLALALVFVLTLPLLTPRVAASDEIEYFSYLHSLVFDHDLDFRNEYEHFCNLDPQDCADSRFRETFLDNKTPTGLQINFGPIGSALLWSPFYLVAHGVTLALSASGSTIPADGYSAPYIFAISFGSLLYGWIGLALSYRIAREYVGKKIALAATLTILFATNAVYYLYIAPAMSHAPSLFASALFVFVWFRTRESRAAGNYRAWALLGVCGALMTMVREQEAIFVLLPLVESGFKLLTAKNAENAKIKREIPLRSWQFNYLAGFATMLATWFLAFTPQFAVYKILNGNFLPAKDVTQKFTFDGAHLGEVLFSNLHGLFSWTPITLFAVLGLFLLSRRDRVLALAFVIAFAAELYLLGSFSTWFGGAAFGMRRFVNCTVLFVIGLAMLIETLRARVPLPALATIGALFILWNLFFIVQFATGMIPRAQPIEFSTLAYNQVFIVPPRLADLAYRFVTARATFYKK